MYKSILAVVLITLTFISNANEQPVDRLFEVMGMEKQLINGFDAMMPIIDQSSASLNLNKNQKQEFINIYKEWFLEDVDQQLIIYKIKSLYEQEFTHYEMEELIKFYQTATGQKLLVKSPVIMEASALVGIEQASKKKAALLQKLDIFYKMYGLK